MPFWCDPGRQVKLDIVIAGEERARARIVGLGCEPRLTLLVDGSERDSLVFPSTGYRRCDALLGELLAIARLLPDFKLGVAGKCYREALERLKDERPELFSDDPLDVLVFSYVLDFLSPSRVVGPGLLDFIGTVSRLARLGAERVDVHALLSRRKASPESLLGKLVVEGVRASGFKFSVPPVKMGLLTGLFEEMLWRHYPGAYRALSEESGLRRLFPVFEEPELLLLSDEDVFEELLNFHLNSHSRLPARVRVERREDWTFNLRLRLCTPSMRLLVDAPITLSPSRTARLAGETARIEFTGYSPITLLWKYYEEDGLMEVFRDTYVFAGPGRIVYVSPKQGTFLTARSIRKLQRLAPHVSISRPGDVLSILLRTDTLKRLGDRFYESPEQERAVLLTGCLACKRHILINESLALAETVGGSWILGALPITGTGPIRVRAQSPREAFYSSSILGELTMLVLDGAEEYAPGLAGLNRFTWKLWKELGSLIVLVDVSTAPWSGPGLSLLLYIVLNRRFRIYTSSLEPPVGRIAIINDSEENHEYHIQRNMRRLEEESRSWLPVPESTVETLLEAGFEPAHEHDTFTAYRHGNIYVFLKSNTSLF